MKTKITSRFLVAVLLCLTFALALVPLFLTTVTAAESGHTHCICGNMSCTDAAHGDVKTFDNVLPTAGGTLAGYYYLDGNVTLENTITVAEGTTLNICLNGYALKGNGTNRVIYVDPGSELNICDCNGSHSEHKFTVNETSKLWEYAGDFGVGDIESPTVKKVIGGVITGGNDAGDANGGGSGVFIFQRNNIISTVNMYNITIAGNNSGGLGGGVNNNFGVLSMYNITVVGNTAPCGGGIANICNPGGVGRLSIYGGIISDNVVSETGNVGGGGGIWTSGDNVLNNVTVSGNTVITSGGGIHADREATLHMTNTVISGNTAGLKGGGVYGDAGCKVNISGKVRIVDNIANSVPNNLELTRYYEPPFKAHWPETDIYSSVCIAGELDKDTSIGITRIPTYAKDGMETYPITVVEGTSGETPYTVKNTDVKRFFADKNLQHIAYNVSGACLDLAEGAPPHEHNFTYTASDNVITAHCNNEGCDITSDLTLTLNATACGKVYNGSACTAATIVGITEWTAAGLEPPTIYYEGVSPTSYSRSADRPVNAGTYKATITVEDATAETASFTILKASQTEASIIVPAGSFYGNPLMLSVSKAKESPRITYQYDYFDIGSRVGYKDYTTDTVLDVGSYSICAILAETENYSETKVNYAGQITVIAAPMTGISASNVTKTYDGNEYGITLTGVPDGATVTYGTVYGTYDHNESPKFKNASNTPYTVYYKVTKPNYDDFRGSAKVTINKLQLTEAMFAPLASVTYNGSEHKPTLIPLNPTLLTTSDFDVSYGNNVNAGTASVYVTAKDTGNYTGTASKTWSIEKAPGKIEIDNLSQLSMTYCGSKIDNPIPDYLGTGTPHFEYKRKGAEEPFDDERPMDAGTWIIRATVPEDNNYEEVTVEVEITISPKDIKDALITLGETLTYNGSVQTQTLENVTVDGLTVTYTVSGNTETNAGENYTLTVTGTGNYTGTASKTWSIAKQRVNQPGADTASFVYNGNNQTYTLKADEKYTVAGTTGKDAKTYTATVTLNDTNNYQWADGTTEALTFDWTIERKSIAGAVVSLDKTVLTENGTPQTQLIESVKVDGFDVTYNVTGNTETEAGTYTMTLTANGNFVGTVTQKYVILPKTEEELHKEANTDGKEVVVIGDGNISVDVNKADETAPDTKIATDKRDVIENVLNGAELSKVADGDVANIWVDVKNADNTVTDTSKEQIANKIKENRGLTMGAYIDISLFKQLVSETEPTQIHNLDKTIKVSIVVPEALRKTARTYSIVRNHEGVVDIINGVYDETTHTFTFETDKFSDYGIAYEDHCVICHERAPFLGLCWLTWTLIVLGALCVVGGAVTIIKKKNGTLAFAGTAAKNAPAPTKANGTVARRSFARTQVSGETALIRAARNAAAVRAEQKKNKRKKTTKPQRPLYR